MCESMKQDCYYTSYTKTNSKQIKDLNLGCGTFKSTEEKIREALGDPGVLKRP